MNLRNKINKMVGKTYMYNSHNQTVKGFSIVEDEVTVITNRREISLPLDKAEDMLKDFLPVDDEGSGKPALINMPDQKQVADLKSIVLENIKKVEKDRAYVPQANAINKSINALINMASLELSYYKATKK